MKWTENLECDLEAARREEAKKIMAKEIDQDQPGPSGISNKISIAPKDEENNQDDDEDANESKKQSPIELFAEKVTIAGLPEAYNAKLKADRIMFRWALMAAVCMMIFQAIAIAKQYKDQHTISIDKKASDRVPFPSVTVCIPTTINNLFSRLFPRISDLPKRDADFMIKHNLTNDDANNFLKDFFAFNVKPSDLGKPLYIGTKKLFNAASDLLSKNGQKSSLQEILTPSCPEVLSNCVYEGRHFDCCDGALSLTTWELFCFQIDTRITNNNQSIDKIKNPLQSDNVGLSVDVSKNWTTGVYDMGSASDGFHVFIDSVPSVSEVPVPVPAGMNAVIALARAKKESKITQCFTPEQAPLMKYFNTYDSHGLSCMGETFLNVLHNFFGCLMPVGSFFPTNQTCSFEQLVGINLAISDDESFIESSVESSNSKALKQRADEVMQSMAALYSDQSPCKPLCTKWTYSVFSTSYGSIRYRDKEEEKRQLADRSWSRIRIILPDDSYTYIQETAIAASYMAVCDIGGMMGVWAGLSMITFAQILFYGYYILWSKVREKIPSGKVEPSQLQPSSIAASVSKTHVETSF